MEREVEEGEGEGNKDRPGEGNKLNILINTHRNRLRLVEEVLRGIQVVVSS
jgi:hypothetical protein